MATGITKAVAELHEAAACGQVKAVAELLESGLDANSTVKKWDLTALHVAVESGHLPVVELLLAQGADPNLGAVYGSPDPHKQFGSPLHSAAAFGRVDCVRPLLEGGAQVNAVDVVGATSLHRASMEGHSEIAKILLRRGGNVHARDAMLRTPLHYAAQTGLLETVRVLIEVGSGDVNAVDDAGNAPVDLLPDGADRKLRTMLATSAGRSAAGGAGGSGDTAMPRTASMMPRRGGAGKSPAKFSRQMTDGALLGAKGSKGHKHRHKHKRRRSDTGASPGAVATLPLEPVPDALAPPRP